MGLLYSPSTKHDDVAVNMLDAVNSMAWSNRNRPFMAAPTPIANRDTMKAATVACTCTSAILPTIMWMISRVLDMLPRFDCVESRDARHMSRLPLRPSRAGTRMNSSVTWWNTFQRWKRGKV